MARGRVLLETPLTGGELNLISSRDLFDNIWFNLPVRLIVGGITLENYLDGDVVNWILGYYGQMSNITIGQGNHIGYIGWIVEYGLITFLPLIMFMTYLMKKLLMLRRRYLDHRGGSNELNLVVLCFGIMTAFLTKMLTDPAGHHFWLFLGFISAAAHMSCKKIARRNPKDNIISEGYNL